jgi:hypothetical protein
MMGMHPRPFPAIMVAMNAHLRALAMVVGAFAVAQSPLVTTFASNNSGSVGGGIYFDLTANVAVTITALDVALGVPMGIAGSVDVLTCAGTRTGNQTNAAVWTQVSTGAVTSAGPGAPSTVAIAPFPLAPGIHGIAFRGVGVGFAYTNGNGGNGNYATGALSLAAGEATNVAFTSPLVTSRVVDCRITYTVPAGVVEAAATPYGAGCYNRFASFYEFFATAAQFDLANSSLSMQPVGGGYHVVPGVVNYVPPSAAATTLALGDDSEVTVALSAPLSVAGGNASSLTVCSNGFVSVASGNGVGFDPDVPTMLAAPQTAWWAWHDFDPTLPGSGQVKFEEVGSVACITWDGVWDYGGASASYASTQQFQFDESTGAVHILFLTMSAQGNGHLVGYSPGGASADPGNSDLEAALAAAITLVSPSAAESPALALTGSPRPVIGNTVVLRTSLIPAGTPLGLMVFGLLPLVPGVDLTSLGMPGCFQWNNALLMRTFAVSGATANTNMFVPNNNALAGVHLYAQSATLTSGLNAFGLISSNGLDLLAGNL